MKFLYYFKAITATVTTSEKRVFTLVAIVVLFLVCNTIKVAINSYDMAHYTQVKFHFHRSCQTFNADSTIGYIYSHFHICLHI